MPTKIDYLRDAELDAMPHLRRAMSKTSPANHLSVVDELRKERDARMAEEARRRDMEERASEDDYWMLPDETWPDDCCD